MQNTQLYVLPYKPTEILDCAGCGDNLNEKSQWSKRFMLFGSLEIELNLCKNCMNKFDSNYYSGWHPYVDSEYLDPSVLE